MTTCAICGGPIVPIADWTQGNNAHPFDGRACDECDNRFVTPARMFQVTDPAILKLLCLFAVKGRELVQGAAAARTLRAVD